MSRSWFFTTPHLFTPPPLAKSAPVPAAVPRDEGEPSEIPYEVGDYLLCHDYQTLSAQCQVVIGHVGGTRYWVHCEGTSESETVLIDVEADYDRVVKVSAEAGPRPRNLSEDIPKPYTLVPKTGGRPVPRPPKGPPPRTEGAKGPPPREPMKKAKGKGGPGPRITREKAWAFFRGRAVADEARGARYLEGAKTEAESGRVDWSGFCEQVEAEGLEAVGQFYVPCEDEKLRGLLDGRIIRSPTVSAAKSEVDSFQANAGWGFDWAVKRLKEADPRFIVIVKRMKENETDRKS